jgi:outer membrane protein assembly factor BamD
MAQSSVFIQFRVLTAMSLLAVLGACSSDDEIEYRELTVYEIYNQATEYLEDKRFRDAALYFDEVERQHPYSVWATKSKLMSAYSHYMNNKYDDAIASLDRFIQVHPGNRDVVYAYYLKALCYYEQISDVERDQDMTQQALIALEDVITRFPGTAYARDARLKIDLTRDHLAGKEMAVGRFYLNRDHYLSAINRFKVVVQEYGNTTHAPEALFRLTEAYTALGLRQEARRSAAVLGYNYPGSDWYEDAYDLAGLDRDARAQREQEQAQLQENSDKPWWQLW